MGEAICKLNINITVVHVAGKSFLLLTPASVRIVEELLD